MKKFFTKMALMVAFVLGVTAMNAQIIWPNDSASTSVSQFVNAATIRYVKKDTALNASLANYKGWITVGLASADAARADSAVFMWSPTGAPHIGSYRSATLDTRMTSLDTTRGFGAALFSSDFLDSRGLAADGVGQAPAPHTGELWSPIFDATGFNNLSLMFQQSNRHFQSSSTIDCFQSTAVSWSEDGGVTWKPLQCIEENEGYGLYERLPRNTPTTIKLVGSKGTNKFRIKFHFDGDYYYWLLDDVRVGVLRNNVTLSKSWAALPTAAMQRNNTDSVRFMVDVVNNGTVPARNVRVTADVINGTTGAVAFTTTRNYGTLAADSVAQNELLPQAFFPPNSAATNYNIRYKVTYDSTDMFQRDDSIMHVTGLRVRDSLFTNEQPGGFLLGYAPTVSSTTRAWKLGQYYYFPKGATSTATRISGYAETATTTARTYTAGLYEWNDTNGNDSVEVGERRLVAAGETNMPAGGASNILDIKLENFLGTTPVYLKNNQAYLAMIEITPSVASTTWFNYFDDRARYSYGPLRFATKKAGAPRYGGIIDINGSDPNSIWRTSVFGGTQYNPRVSLFAWPIRIDTKDDLPSTYKIAVYPNPVGETLNVNVDFPKSEEAVLFRIFDLKGQLLQEKELMNIQKETVNMNVNQLANGNYLLQVQTVGNQAKTLKFVKAN